MDQRFETLSAYYDQNRDRFIDIWETLVNHESYSGDTEDVNSLAEKLAELFKEAGTDAETVSVGANGNSVVGTAGSSSSERPVVFSGHFDTVHKKGSFGDSPFKIEDGRAYGPGVLDMKGGIVIALAVMKAFHENGGYKYPLKIVLSGDEETGHKGSKGGQLIMDAVKGAICAFNVETGLPDNSICIGRKGRIGARITASGVDAHAGADFTAGRNAIEELAFKITRFRDLTDMEMGTTVATTLVSGGTVSNAIPKEAVAELDIRFEKQAEKGRVEEALKELLRTPDIEGTTLSYEQDAFMGAFETTDDVLKFHDFVRRTAEQYGMAEVGSRYLGGSSDASYIGDAGVPVLCSFGVLGEFNHTKNEYAMVETLFERMKLITAVLLELENSPMVKGE